MTANEFTQLIEDEASRGEREVLQQIGLIRRNARRELREVMLIALMRPHAEALLERMLDPKFGRLSSVERETIIDVVIELDHEGFFRLNLDAERIARTLNADSSAVCYIVALHADRIVPMRHPLGVYLHLDAYWETYVSMEIARKEWRSAWDRLLKAAAGFSVPDRTAKDSAFHHEASIPALERLVNELFARMSETGLVSMDSVTLMPAKKSRAYALFMKFGGLSSAWNSTHRRRYAVMSDMSRKVEKLAAHFEPPTEAPETAKRKRAPSRSSRAFSKKRTRQS